MEIDIIWLDQEESTNRYAADLLQRDPEVSEWTTIVAHSQTAGRGQRGNTWESESGKNLTFSLISYPIEIEPAKQFVLSQAVSLGIIDFLSSYSDGFSVKWPNDIYWQEKKICGILIENTLQYDSIKSCVIGIGININQTVFRSDAPNPVSLSNVTGETYDLKSCLTPLLSAVIERIIKLRNGDDFAEEYLMRLFRFHKKTSYRASGLEFEGEIVDVEQNGQLVIKNVSTGDVRKFWFKEVEFMFDREL